jgi:hypothetical protein
MVVARFGWSGLLVQMDPFRDGGRVGLYDGGSAFDNYRAPQFMDNRIFYLQGGLASLLG